MNVVSGSGMADETLQRFLDGELDDERYLEVQESIESDEGARARFEQLRQINDLVAGYNRSVLSEPVPARLAPHGRRRLLVDWRRIAAGIMLLGLGALIGWGLTGTGQRAGGGMLIERAVAAHELYAREVLHAVEIDGDRKAHLGKWLSKRLGAEVTIPDLTEFGYRLLGGRLLPGEDLRADGMLVYEKPDGSRISVYVIRSDRPEHTNTLYTRKADMHVFYWKDVVLSCAVVAGTGNSDGTGRLRVVSDSVYRQIEL